MHIETPAHNLVNLEGPALIAAIKNDFDLDITNPEKVINGFNSQVFRAKLGDEIVFIRINKRADKFESEILGYDIFEKIGIPGPKLVAYQRLPETIGQPTMILSAANGVSIREAKLSPEMEEKVYEQLGSMLRKIHEYKIEGYGPLKSSGGKVEGKYRSWAEYYESRNNRHEPALAYLLEKKIITEEEAQVVRRTRQELKSLDVGEASILHQDLNGSHIFVKDGQITGIIDLEKIMAGDPRADIANALVFQADRQQIAFKKGYGDLANDFVVLKYILVTAAGKVSFRLQQGLPEAAERVLALFKHAFKEITAKNKKGISS